MHLLGINLLWMLINAYLISSLVINYLWHILKCLKSSLKKSKIVSPDVIDGPYPLLTGSKLSAINQVTIDHRLPSIST